MRALAKLFEIACVLLAIVTILFLLAAVEGNSPPSIHQHYVEASLFAGTCLLASIAACLFCVARIKPQPDPHHDASSIPPHDPLQHPSIRVITKLLHILTLLFLVAALFAIAIVANSKGPRPPGDPYFYAFCLLLAACFLCTIASDLIKARWKKRHHHIAKAEDHHQQPRP